MKTLGLIIGGLILGYLPFLIFATVSMISILHIL